MADGYILSHLAGRVDEALGAILAEDPAESKTSGFVGSETIALLDGINVKYSSIKNVLENVPFVRLSGISDKTTITWDPLHYVPDAGIAQADTVDDLVAHLKGIDTLLASIDITIGEDVVNSTDGSVLFVGTGGILAQDNGGLFYLNGPDYLGVGTNNPLDQIHSAGNISANGVIKIGRNAANHVQLKNVDGVLYVRNQTDAANADLVVNNITITGIVEQLAGDVIELGDQFITLNADYTGATPTADAGLRVERGDLTNASFLWDESSDIWKAGLLGSETRVLVEDASGNWMLGSGTADTKLHVDGRISVGTPSFASTGLIAILGGDNDTIIESLNSDQASAAQLFWRHNGLHVEYGNAAAGDLRVFANNTEVARFLSTGELGLNETLPTARLHITSSANAVVDQIRLHNDDINPTTGTAILFTGHSSDYNRVRLRAIADASALDGNFDIQTSTDGSAFTTGLRVTHDRNVLIGTETNNGSRFRVEKSGGVVADITSLTSGASTLQLTGFSASTTLTTPAGGSNIILRNSDATPGNYSAIQFQDAQGQITSAIYGNYVDHAADEGELVFMVTPNLGSLVEAFRINSDKNATLQGKLTVVGDIEAGTASSFFFDDSLGRVGINRGTSPEASLDVAAFNATTRALRVAGATSQTADIFVVTNSLATADYLKVDASGLVSTEQPVTIRHGASTPGLVLLDADANGSSAHLYIGFARDNQTVEGFGVGLNAVDNSFVISGKANSLTTNKFLIIDGAGAATFSNTATFLGTVTANSTDGTIRIDATRGTGHNWRIQTSGTNAEALEIYDVTNSTRKMLFDSAGTEITGTLDVAGKVTITNSYLQISRSAPYIYLDDSDQVDGNWRLLADGGNFYISQMNDAGAFNQHVITIASDGSTTANTDLYIAGNLWLQDNAIFNNNVELRWKDSVGTERTVLELASDNSVNIGSSAGGGIIFRGNSYGIVGSVTGAGVWSFPNGEMTVSGANAEFNINSTSGNPYLRFQDGGIDQWYISYDTGGTRLVIGEDTVGSRLTIQDGVGGEIGLLSNTSITGTLATSQPITVTRSGAAAKLTLARTSSSTSSWTIGSGVAADTLSFINEAGGGGSDAANTRLTLTNTTAAFTGAITYNVGGQTTTLNGSTFGTGGNISSNSNMRIGSAGAGGYLFLYSANVAALTFDASQVATFASNTTISKVGADGGLTLKSLDTTIGSTQQLGSIRAQTTDTNVTTNPYAARIDFMSDGPYGSNAAPGQIYFYTNDGVGTGALQLALKLDSSQDATLSGNIFVSKELVAGNGYTTTVPLKLYSMEAAKTSYRLSFNTADAELPKIYMFDEIGSSFFRVKIGGDSSATVGLIIDEAGNTEQSGTITLTGSNKYILAGSNSDDLVISAGMATNGGGNLTMWGSTHGTTANDYRFRAGSTEVYYYDSSATQHTFTGLFDLTSTGNTFLNINRAASTSGARLVFQTTDVDQYEIGLQGNNTDLVIRNDAGTIFFSMDPSGATTFNADLSIAGANILLDNTRKIRFADSLGTDRDVLVVGASDILTLGSASLASLSIPMPTTISDSLTVTGGFTGSGLVTATNGGAFSGPTGETGFRIKFEDVGGTNNDTGIGQHASGSLWFNTGSNGQTRFYGGTDGELLRISSNATLANSTLNWYGGSATFAGSMTLSSGRLTVADTSDITRHITIDDGSTEKAYLGNYSDSLFLASGAYFSSPNWVYNDAGTLPVVIQLHGGSGSVRFRIGDDAGAPKEVARLTTDSFLLGTDTTSGNAQLYTIKTYNNTTSHDYASYFRYTQSVATTAGLQGNRAEVHASHTTGTVSYILGQHGYVNASGAGGTTTNAYALYATILASNATATITNAYGLYIPAFSATGTITNRWAIYQSGTSDHNYLAGGLFLNDPTKAGNTRFVVSNQANNYADGMNLHSTHATNSARLFFESAAGANGVYSNNGDLIITGNADPGVSSGSTVAQFTSNGNLYIASGDLRVGTTSATSHAEESFRVVSTAARAANIHRAAASGASYLQFTNDTTGTTNTDGGYVGIDGNSAVRLWNHEAGNILFATSDTERVRVASDAYVLGIGITDPNTWGSTFGAVQMGGGLSLWGRTVDTDGYSGGLTYNATNNGTGWVYHYADEASIYTLGANGVHIWSTATAGTTGAAITFSERMRLNNSGQLGIGITAPDGTVHVHTASAGTIAANGSANDLVIENSTHGGISILVPDSSEGAIYFGSPSANIGAFIAKDYDAGYFAIGTAHTAGYIELRSGNNVTALTLDSSQIATFASQIRVEDGNAIIDRDGSSNLSITTYAGADILFNAGGTLSFSLDAATNDAAFTSDVRVPQGKKFIMDNAAHYLWRSTTGSAQVELAAAAPIFLTTTGSYDIRFRINSNEVGRIDTAGNFLWGATSTSNNAQFYVTKTYGNSASVDHGTSFYFIQSVATTGQIQGNFTYVRATHATGTVATAKGLYGYVSNTNTGTLTDAVGIQGTTRNDSTGAVTNAYAGLFYVGSQNAGGAITNGYGVYVDAFGTTGSITNGYGVYLGTIGGSTSWGIYQAGSSNNNYLAGSLRIGTTSATSHATEVLRLSSSGGDVANVHRDSSGAAYIQFTNTTTGTSTTDGFKIGIAADESAQLANLEATAMGFRTADTERFRVASNAYALGIGTTDVEAWVSTGAAIEFGKSAIYAQNTGNFISIGSNFYTDGVYKYKDANPAVMLALSGGEMLFRTAVSGTANASLTWSEKMRLTNDGLFGIGTTSPALSLHVSSGKMGAPVASGTTQTNGTARLRGNDNGILDFGFLSGGAGAWLQSTDQSNLANIYPLLLNPNGGSVIVGAQSTSSNAQFYATKTYSGTVTVNAAYFKYTQDTASGSALLRGLYGEVIASHTTGTVGEIRGTTGYAQTTGSGGTTSLVTGMQAAVAIGVGSTATVARSFYIPNKTRSGSIGTDWAIQSEDTAASYLAGSLRIGATSATSHGEERLRVYGSEDRIAVFERDDSLSSTIHFANSSTGTSTSGGFQVGIDEQERAVFRHRHSNAPMLFYTNNAERMRIAGAASMLSIGTASTWAWSGYSGIDFEETAMVGQTGSGGDLISFVSNAYYDGAWKAKTTGESARFSVNADSTQVFMWERATTGTANALINGGSGAWTELMRLDSSGNLGIGTSFPDGRLHVFTASAGTVTADGAADDFIVENSSHGGISILTPNSVSGAIYFGDPDDNNSGRIVYNHVDDSFAFITAAVANGGASALAIDSGMNATFAANVTINGDLSVLGDSVTFTVGDLDVQDKVITIAVGSANGIAADGSGLEVDRGTDTNATMLWNNTNLAFDFNYGISSATTITAPRLRLTAADDASLSSTLHAFQVGSTSGLNITIDNNEILARNNGLNSDLNLNTEGAGFTRTGNLKPATNGTHQLGASDAYWGDFYVQVIRLGNEIQLATTGTASDVTLTYQGDEDTGFNYNSSGTIDYVSNGVVALTLGANATFTGDVTVNKSTANAAISIVAGSTFGATLALNTSANSWDIVSFGTGSAFSGKLAIRDGASVVTTWDEQGNLILGATSTSSNAQFYATKTYSSGTNYALYSNPSISAGSELDAILGKASVTATSGTVGYGIAVHGYFSGSGSGGTTTYGSALWATYDVATGHTVTNAYSLYLSAKTGGGTRTNDWAIYSADTAASYLSGSLRIGTTSATSHGGEKFRVDAGNIIAANFHRTSASGTNIQFTNSDTGTTAGDGFLVGIDATEAANLINYESTPIIVYTAGTERFRVASNAYALGIGTTDVEAWSSSYAAVEFSGAAIMGGGAGSELYHFSNAYYDGSFKYKRTGQASALIQDSNGRFLWSTAASGTLNTTLTWSEKMRLTNAGDLEMAGGGAISTTGTLASGNATVASATPFMRVQDSDSAGTAAVPIFELYDSTSRIGYLGFTSAVTGHMSLVNSVTNGDLNITTTGTGSIILSASGTGAIALQENTTVTGTLAVSYGSGTFPASFTRTGDPMALYAYSDAGGVAIAGNSSASLTGAQYIYLSPSGIIAEVPSGDTHNMSVNGSTVLSVASTGATVTGTLGVTGNVTLSAGSLIIPNGVITLGDESVSSAYFQTQESMYFNIDTNNNESALWHWTHGGTLASGTRVMALTEAGELILGGGTATSSNAQFYATKTYSAASGTDIASYFYYRQSAATTGGLIAVNGVGEAVHTSGTVAELHGLRGLSQANSPGGTVTNVYAGYFWARNISATATITNAYSIYVANKTRSGTITNDWALYSADTAASYLAGSLRIGTTSATSHGGEKLLVSSAGSTNPFVSLVATDSANAYIQFVNSTTGTTASDGLVLGLAADESVVLNNKESTPTRFFTADTERFRVASNAYALGIGTTDLETWSGSYGAIEFGQSAIIGHTTNSELTFASNSYKDAAGWKYKATGVAALQQIVNGSHYWFTAVSGTADATTSWGNSKMTLTNGGALLIGTTGASSYGSELLRVSSSAVHQLNIHGTSSDARLFFSTNSSGSSAADGFQIGIESNSSALLWNRENGYMRFGTNNAERMRIGSNASVLGIGTADLEAWVATGSAIEFGESAIYAQNTGNFISIGSNFYSDGTYRYKDTSSAAMLAILDGAFQFRTAPNGTANNALTWNTMMNLSNTGELTLNGILMGAQSNADVDTGTETVATVAHASYDAVFFDYVIKNGTNTRTGTIYVAHDGTNVSYAETSTVDIGDTTDVTLSVDISGADIRLLATTTSDNWTVKALVRGI